jgi:adhesin HecA-like repeat protein
MEIHSRGALTADASMVWVTAGMMQSVGTAPEA